MSTKANITTFTASTRAECARMCVAMNDCAGFNIHSLSSGLYECEIKDGPSGTSDIKQGYNVTYYGREGLFSRFSFYFVL